MTAPSPGTAVSSLMAAYWPSRATSTRKPPWTWSALSGTDREALADVVDDWVDSYNAVYAVTETDVIPGCWPQHPWLAHELAVMTFTWWSAHYDPTSTAERAAEYYLRYLPSFRTRLPATLGRSPIECQQGHHPTTWRRETDQLIASWRANDQVTKAVLTELGAAAFGFRP